MAFQLTHTTIRVEGNDADIIFSNLFINQQLADVNSFNFTWRQPEGEASLSSQISFYSDNLAKEITITIGDDFTFKGIIYAINCNNQDSLGVSYDISGKGLFERLNRVPECHSFYKKTLSQIFNAVNNTTGTTLNLSPSNTDELFYTVQYNQTGFAFLRMMCSRYGEWFYYSGTEMLVGPPTGDAITLNQGQDINNIDISAKLVRGPQNNTSFDRHTGEEITHQPQSSSIGGFIGAARQAGETAYGSNQSMTNISAAATSQVLNNMSSLSQKAADASAVILRATSNNNKLKLASKIKIMDEGGHSLGEYYITEVHHKVTADSNYQNQIVAIPAEAEVPPYTNPFVVPLCKAQPARVKDNEDADGLGRIKVHFPWQGDSDNSPWLNVITPHAGKDKGFHFLPELDEEVMVDFLDNNAERPYVIGSMHTDKNKSGYAHEGNHIKSISTKSGRRFEIDEKKKTMVLADDFNNQNKKNIIEFKKEDDPEVSFKSQKDESNASVVTLKNSESLKIELKDGGATITEIIFEKSGKKITIHSTDTIEIKADKELKLSSPKISINGSQEVKVEGMTVELDGKTELKAKGLNATFEGSMKADFKAGAVASLTGGIVKIN